MKLSMWHTERKTALLIESPFALTAYEFTANRGKNQLKSAGKCIELKPERKERYRQHAYIGEVATRARAWSSLRIDLHKHLFKLMSVNKVYWTHLGMLHCFG